MDAMVSISIYEFERLIRADEKLNAVKRLLDQQGYVSDSDIRSVLDIPEKEKIAAEKVVEKKENEDV